MRIRDITERQLKNAIDWFVSMHTWETTIKSIRKTERMKKRLEDYVSGDIKLISPELKKALSSSKIIKQEVTHAKAK